MLKVLVHECTGAVGASPQQNNEKCVCICKVVKEPLSLLAQTCTSEDCEVGRCAPVNT